VVLVLKQESVDQMSDTRFVVGMEEGGHSIHIVMER
jgi:hypothetical protein